MVLRLIRICKIPWWCPLFLFSNGNTLFGHIWSKKQNCQFKQKLGTKNICNMQNSIVLFFCFPLEIPYLSKFDQKNKDCQFKLKFGTCPNSNMENSMLMFIFFVFKWKYPFWANLVPKFITDCLKWNLVPRLIRTFTIKWRCLRFRPEIPFLGKCGRKNRNFQFKLKFNT